MDTTYKSQEGKIWRGKMDLSVGSVIGNWKKFGGMRNEERRI